MANARCGRRRSEALCADNFSAIEQLRRHAINNAASRDRGEIKRARLRYRAWLGELNDHDSDDAESSSRCVIRNFTLHYTRPMNDACHAVHAATAPIHGNVILSENGSKKFAAKYTFVSVQIQGECLESALRFSRSTLRTFTGNLRDNHMEMYATGCFRAVTNSRHVSPCVCMCVYPYMR